MQESHSSIVSKGGQTDDGLDGLQESVNVLISLTWLEKWSSDTMWSTIVWSVVEVIIGDGRQPRTDFSLSSSATLSKIREGLHRGDYGASMLSLGTSLMYETQVLDIQADCQPRDLAGKSRNSTDKPPTG